MSNENIQKEIPLNSFLLTAFYDWIVANQGRPYIVVVAEGLPAALDTFVKEGIIILNISPMATDGLDISQEHVHFNARFHGVSTEVFIPMTQILSIYNADTDQGMALPSLAGETASVEEPVKARPTLSIVK